MLQNISRLRKAAWKFHSPSPSMAFHADPSSQRPPAPVRAAGNKRVEFCPCEGDARRQHRKRSDGPSSNKAYQSSGVGDTIKLAVFFSHQEYFSGIKTISQRSDGPSSRVLRVRPPPPSLPHARPHRVTRPVTSGRVRARPTSESRLGPRVPPDSPRPDIPRLPRCRTCGGIARRRRTCHGGRRGGESPARRARRRLAAAGPWAETDISPRRRRGGP